MSFTYNYSPYPLNADFIKFYPDPTEPEFAGGIPDEPEFDIQPAPATEAGEPGAFFFKLKLTWEALLSTNEPLFQENEANGYKVCQYAVNIFEDPQQLCRRLTFYNPGPYLKLVSVGEPSNAEIIENNNYAEQRTIAERIGFEPGSVYCEPSTPQGARFGDWLKINEYSLPATEPMGVPLSIIPGKPACYITEPNGTKYATGYEISEPEFKFLEPACTPDFLTIGWFSCSGMDVPNEAALDGSKAYITTGSLIGGTGIVSVGGGKEWSCYDCGVCFRPTPPNQIAKFNFERHTKDNYANYEPHGYQPSIPRGFPQPWGEPSTDQTVPQPLNPCLASATGEPGEEPSSQLGNCIWGNWGPSGAEPDYGYSPPWSDYLVDGYNCQSCNQAMARNSPYTEPTYEDIFWVDALGNVNEQYTFNSAKTFILNKPEPGPAPKYTGADSCYGRIASYSCTPGESNLINYWYNNGVKTCIENIGEPQCLDPYWDCNEPITYPIFLNVPDKGKATPLNIPVLDTNIDHGRSSESTVRVNDWFNNIFEASYIFIINQVCGSQSSYIPINGLTYTAIQPPGVACSREPSAREPSAFKINSETQTFKALSNKPYLAIVNQIWAETAVVEEELPEDILFAPTTTNKVAQLAITQATNVGGFKKRPPPEPPEPPPIPPPPVPGAGGGPGNVFKLEGLCQGKYNYNCNYVRYRPELSMNYQPIAGHPLPYKYIDTMGSSLAKNRQNANLIINASAHRKNTVNFISRNPICGEYDQCKPSPKCPQCTGNRNPNNNPL